jgi:hypothetical protein
VSKLSIIWRLVLAPIFVREHGEGNRELRFRPVTIERRTDYGDSLGKTCRLPKN